MKMIDILPLITKKKIGIALQKAEIQQIVDGFSVNQISDSQMAALLMTFQFKPLTDHEILAFFDVIYATSKKINVQQIPGFKIDKHSTGGIGDKVTLCLIALLNSLNIKMYKYSGKRLGYTGGTIDKLSAIPDFKHTYKIEQFVKQAARFPVVISNNIDVCPFENKVYELRSHTGSLEPVGLIATSIMIKKIFINNDALLLDVKVGSGALFKTLTLGREFARLAQLICQRYNRPVKIVISDMNEPLGKTIGNKLEIFEALDLLAGKGDSDLRELVVTLAANALVMKRQISFSQAKTIAKQQLTSGKALPFFKQFVISQNGDYQRFIEQKNVSTKRSIAIKAEHSGYFCYKNVQDLGHLFNLLSVDQTGKLDFDAGIILDVKNGQKVQKDQILMHLKTNFMFLEVQNLVKQANQTFEIKTKLPQLRSSIVIENY